VKPVRVRGGDRHERLQLRSQQQSCIGRTNSTEPGKVLSFSDGWLRLVQRRPPLWGWDAAFLKAITQRGSWHGRAPPPQPFEPWTDRRPGGVGVPGHESGLVIDPGKRASRLVHGRFAT
jgi:hypothetical protein